MFYGSSDSRPEKKGILENFDVAVSKSIAVKSITNSVSFVYLKYIRRTEISAGLTPEILPAWPMERGLI